MEPTSIKLLFCSAGIHLNLQKVWNRNAGKNLASVEMKVDWNLPIPQNMKNFLTSSSNKQQATGDADMLMVKEALVKAEEFDIAVVHSRDTDVLIALSHHLDGDLETKKGCASISEIVEQLSSEMRECLPFAHPPLPPPAVGCFDSYVCI